MLTKHVVNKMNLHFVDGILLTDRTRRFQVCVGCDSLELGWKRGALSS